MSIYTFSSLKRAECFAALAKEPLDLLIIGGGITGAGILLDAVTRGLKVGLVEMKDFASGTSSKSTKLIHGGLRYLKQLEFRLVREVGKERAVLHRNAPHLVIPVKMFLPIVEGGSLGKFSTAIALWVYDRLAGVEKEERFRMYNASKVPSLEPLLNMEGVKGGALYVEYRTDDARLTIETLKTAVEKGAMAINYAKAISILYKNGQAAGAQVFDTIRQESYDIYAKRVVNAAGPWVDEVRGLDEEVKGKRLHLTKGIHLVVPFEKLPLQHAVYFDVFDGRMIFAIPRGRITYIGTTDTNYASPDHNPTITSEDISYVLNAVNRMFTNSPLRKQDILSTWAGLRPLIHEDGKSPSELSRKDEIFYANSGLISIAGGKLTGFRKMAERVVDVVLKSLKKEGAISSIPSCQTDKIRLKGNTFQSAQEVKKYIIGIAEQYKAQGIDEKTAEYLVHNYGHQTGEILAKQAAFLQKEYDTEEALILAEVDFCIRHEMVTRLDDFWVRRTGRLYFNRPSMERLMPVVGEYVTELFGWDTSRQTDENLLLAKMYHEVLKTAR